MALHVLSYFPTTIMIDGSPIPIRVKRLDPRDMLTFDRELKRTGQPAAKAPDGETLDQTAAREQQEWELAVAAHEFNTRSIADAITVEPGHLVEGEEQAPVTDGAGLVRLFGAREAIIQELLFDIVVENRWSAAAKVAFRASLTPAPQVETEVAA